MTRGAGRGACARGGAGLVEALRSGPDRAEPRRPGPAEERAKQACVGWAGLLGREKGRWERESGLGWAEVWAFLFFLG